MSDLISVTCPRCKARVGENCHDSSSHGAPHRERIDKGVLILFSGGMDSSLLVKRAVESGRRVVPLFVDYGQPHYDKECAAAEAICDRYGLVLRVVERGLHGGLIRGGSPVVPHRNLNLVAYAANRARAERCPIVQIGCCAADAKMFADCRPDYLALLDGLLGETKLAAPLLHVTKREIRRELGRMLPQTWSCYHPQDGEPCGKCGACKARDA